MALEFVAVLEDREEARQPSAGGRRPSARQASDSSRIWPAAADGSPPDIGVQVPGESRRSNVRDRPGPFGPHADPKVGRREEGQLDLPLVGQHVLGATGEVDPDETDASASNPNWRPVTTDCRAGATRCIEPTGRLELELPGADPLEVAGDLAVQRRRHEPVGGWAVIRGGSVVMLVRNSSSGTGLSRLL